MFYLILVFGLLLSIGKNKKQNSSIYACILIILAVFRYGSGPDYFSYKYLFERLKPNVFYEIFYGVDTQELGFRLVGTFLKQIGFTYQLYLAFFAILSLLYIYKISLKYSQNPTLSLTLYYSFYYFVWSLSGIRQGLVMAIGIYYLLEAIKMNKMKKFVVITLLLSFIHASALILFVLLLVSKLQLDKNKLIIFIFLSMIFSVLPFGLLINKMAQYIPILNKVALYSSSENFLNNIIDFQTMGRLFFLIIIIIFYDNYIKTYPEQKKIINIYIFSYVIYFLFQFSELTAARLAIYGRILDIVILINIIYSLKIKRDRLLFVILLSLVMTLYLFKELNAMEKYTGLYDTNPFNTPYVNIFNKDNYFYNTRFN